MCKFKIEINKIMGAVNAVSAAIADKNTAMVIEFSLKEVKTKSGTDKKYLQGQFIACDGKVKTRAPFAYLMPTQEKELNSYKASAEKLSKDGKPGLLVQRLIVDANTFKKNVVALKELGSVLIFDVSNQLTLVCGQSKIHMALLEKVNADFVTDNKFKVAYMFATNKFKNAVNRVQIASATNVGKPACENITFDVNEEGEVNMYAGYRIWSTATVKASAVKLPKEAENQTAEPVQFAVSAAVLKRILNCCNSDNIIIYKMDKQLNIQYGFGVTNAVQLSTASVAFVIPKITEWKEVTACGHAKLDRAEFINALKLVSMAAGTDKVNIGKGEETLIIEASGNMAAVDADLSGDFKTIPTNAQQILTYLQVCNKEECTVSYLAGDTEPLRLAESIESGDEEESSDSCDSRTFIMRFENESEDEADEESTEEAVEE